MIETPPFLQLN